MSRRHSGLWAVVTFQVLISASFYIYSRSPVPKHDNKPSRTVTDLFKHFCMCISCKLVQQMLQIHRDLTSGLPVVSKQTFEGLLSLFSLFLGAACYKRLKTRAKRRSGCVSGVVIVGSKSQQICCSSCCEKNGHQRATLAFPHSLTWYLSQHDDGPQSF